MRPLILILSLVALTACGSIVEPAIPCEPVILVTVVPVGDSLTLTFDPVPCAIP